MTIDEQHEFHFAHDDLEDCDGSQHNPRHWSASEDCAMYPVYTVSPVGSTRRASHKSGTNSCQTISGLFSTSLPLRRMRQNSELVGVESRPVGYPSLLWT